MEINKSRKTFMYLNGFLQTSVFIEYNTVSPNRIKFKL